MLNVKNKEAVNTNFKVTGLTRLGIKPKSTAPEADALSTRPFELYYEWNEDDYIIESSGAGCTLSDFVSLLGHYKIQRDKNSYAKKCRTLPT